MRTKPILPQRKCLHCEKVRPIEEFPLHSRGKPRSTCHDCVLEAARTRELKRRTEEGKARRREQRRARSISEQSRERERRHALRYREKYPEKHEARRLVRAALDRGDLHRPNICEGCGAVNPTRRDGVTAIHAHHDDYSRPLDVRWLCNVCHAQEHVDDVARALAHTTGQEGGRWQS